MRGNVRETAFDGKSLSRALTKTGFGVGCWAGLYEKESESECASELAPWLQALFLSAAQTASAYASAACRRWLGGNAHGGTPFFLRKKRAGSRCGAERIPKAFPLHKGGFLFSFLYGTIRSTQLCCSACTAPRNTLLMLSGAGKITGSVRLV